MVMDEIGGDSGNTGVRNKTGIPAILVFQARAMYKWEMGKG